MRVVIAPDKFKDSLSAAHVAAALARGVSTALPSSEVTCVPMADGGEGTLDAALAAGFVPVRVRACGSLGDPVEAQFALRGDEAVIEMAAASGLALVPGDRRDALAATSRGTGDLILAALEAGARRITLAVGGSACTDGGSGMLAALGASLKDAEGHELPDGGGALAAVARVDLSGLDPRLRETDFVLATDVDHPLLGADGAAAVFGPQKGASEDDVEKLETGLRRFAALVAPNLVSALGAGAAGGVGFGAMAGLDARRESGIDVVMDLVGLESAVRVADLVITGEGSLDHQSLGGKTPVGVAGLVSRVGGGAPCVVVCGRTTLKESAWRAAGFAACLAVADLAPDTESSLRHAATYLERIGQDIMAHHSNPDMRL
ncbi:MAG: glycerate kinase [Galactobacter sp.]